MAQPTRGVSVVVIRMGRVLLVKRSRPPYRGYWSLPGGGLQGGETPKQAARRELREETGLTAGTLRFLDTHYAAAGLRLDVYVCRSTVGEAVAGDDAFQVKWHEIAQLRGLRLTPGLEEVVERAHQLPDTKS